MNAPNDANHAKVHRLRDKANDLRKIYISVSLYVANRMENGDLPQIGTVRH